MISGAGRIEVFLRAVLVFEGLPNLRVTAALEDVNFICG
jgi:hypothetical protein